MKRLWKGTPQEKEAEKLYEKFKKELETLENYHPSIEDVAHNLVCLALFDVHLEDDEEEPQCSRKPVFLDMTNSCCGSWQNY